MYSPWVLSTTSNAAAEPMVTRISSGTDSAVHGRTVGVLAEGRCDAMWDSSLDHVVGWSMLTAPSPDVLACARPRDAEGRDVDGQRGLDLCRVGRIGPAGAGARPDDHEPVAYSGRRGKRHSDGQARELGPRRGVVGPERTTDVLPREHHAGDGAGGCKAGIGIGLGRVLPDDRTRVR